MSRRLVLALSAAVSAFILVVVGAVASYGLRTPPPGPTVASAAPADSVSVDVVLAREAEYRRLIDEANARLRAEQAAAPAETPANGTARAFEHGGDEEEHAGPRTARRHHHEHEEHEHGDHDG